jgi:hypothetical protein
MDLFIKNIDFNKYIYINTFIKGIFKILNIENNNNIEVHFFGDHKEYYSNKFQNIINYDNKKIKEKLLLNYDEYDNENDNPYYTNIFNPFSENLMLKNNSMSILFNRDDDFFHVIKNNRKNYYYKWNDKYSLYIKDNTIFNCNGYFYCLTYMIIENKNYNYEEKNIYDCKAVFSYIDIISTYQLGDYDTEIFVDKNNNLFIFNYGDVKSSLIFYFIKN